MQNQTLQLKNESELLEVAANFAKQLLPTLGSPCCTVFLHGDLGAGKTTFVRGFLQGLGYAEPVKSPTFTFVESYALSGKIIHHFDFYRITDPELFELRGFRDYFINNSICLIEWPSQGEGYLPKADISIFIEGVGEQRCLKIQ